MRIRAYGDHSKSKEADEEADFDRDVRYSQMYEQTTNPFAQFSEYEKNRKLAELSVAERIVLNTMLAIVSNKTGRSFMLFYFGAMHVLVLLLSIE